MKNVSVTLTIPEYVEQKATRSSKQQSTSRAAVLLKWLLRSLAPDILEEVRNGDISISVATEILQMSHHELLALAKTLEIELGPTTEQFQESLAGSEGQVSRRRTRRTTD